MKQRRTIKLSGKWDFALDPEGTASLSGISYDRTITVPAAWQAEFPELQTYSGYAWYRKEFELGEDDLRGEILVQFGAVDYWCEIFVNGTLIGSHEGGYLPFRFSIREFGKAGKNELVVRVYDVAQKAIEIPRWRDDRGVNAAGPPFDPDLIQHGKQEWYINVGGIWQDVELIFLPRTYIDYVRVSPRIDSGEVRFHIHLRGNVDAGRAGALDVEVELKDGEIIKNSLSLMIGKQDYQCRLVIPDHELWTLDKPVLYTARVTLAGDETEDRVEPRFGFREISYRRGKLMLNGDPLYLLSALDQDFYPDTIYTAPSDEYIRDQFAKAKALGLNCLRCHIKPPEPRYLDIADEMGLLVWAELPSWRTFYVKGTRIEQQLHLDDHTKGQVEQALNLMIKRDVNHPSLIIWTLVNEDWGTSLPLSDRDRGWVRELYEVAKGLDPSRLIVDNSGCLHAWGPNVHVKSDLDDFHIYANIPDHADHFEQLMDQFNLRPLWTFSSHGESERNGEEPLILSEFGNWGLPSLDNLKKDGKFPSWFRTGPWWSPWEGEPGWPEGIEERFHRYGLDWLWEDLETFCQASQRHQYRALKFEIETLRRQPSISGYVVTEFTDCYWESNGLLDFERNPKNFFNDFAKVNAEDLVIPYTRRYSFWDDEKIDVKVYASHYGAKSWAGATLNWEVAGGIEKGSLTLPKIARGDVLHVASNRFALPQLREPKLVALRFWINDRDGAELTSNELSVMVLPVASRKATIQREVYGEGREHVMGAPTQGSPFEGIGQHALSETNDPAMTAAPEDYRHHLQRSLYKLGYRTGRKLNPETKLVVTNYPNEENLKWLREGGNMLFIARGASPFFWVQSRSGNYGGSWITSFSWIKPEVHRRLVIENPLGLAFKNVMPFGTILGLPVEDRKYHDDFLAGMIIGWVNHPTIHTVQFRYGRGKVIMTTFAIDDTLENDPIATAMTNDLVEYLISDRCDPKLRANF